MSAVPHLPSVVEALGTQRRLQLLLLRRGSLRWTALALLCLPVVATAVLLGWARGVGLFDDVVRLDLFLLPFLPALATAPLLGGESASQTITYFHTRPAPRWTLLVGRYLAVVPPLIAGFVLSTVACYGIAMIRGTVGDLTENLAHLGRVAAAIALGVPAYAALATMLGALLPRHAMLAVAGWLLVVEAGIGTMVPGWLGLAAMSWHLRQVAGLPQPAALAGAVPDLSPLLSVGVLVAMAALELAVAAATTERGELRGDGADD